MAKKQSYADKIYEELKQNLTSAQPFRQEIITEQKLADQYGVSRMPVRDALTRLCSEGYLVKYRSKGYLVQNIDNITLRKQTELRCFIELGALRKSITTASDKDIRALFALADVPVETRDDVVSSNAEFHSALTALAGNDLASQTVLRYAKDVSHSLVVIGPISYQQRILRESHEAILNAMLERDFEKAAKCLYNDVISDRE